jgi:serine/threonine protein kinase
LGSAGESLDALLIGKKLGHYRMETLIGRGGAGVVFRARDTRLGRRVAIKVLEGNSSPQDAMFQRFVQEARLAARLSHPNVVTIHEVNQDGPHVYIVMELLDGGSVQDRLEQRGRLDWKTAARTLNNVCCGLNAAHTFGLIHRDIKPGNILVDRAGNVKLGDFGLARHCAASGTSLTTDGMVLGTPLFMSPEQCEGHPADRRSDVYSLGATFHAFLTGSPPYPGKEPLQVAFAHCSAPLPDPRALDAKIPESCTAIVRQAMAKRPADRYQHAAEMLADLTDCLGQSAPVTPLRPVANQASLRSRERPRWSHRRRDQFVSAIGAALSLSVVLIVLSLLSTRNPTEINSKSEGPKQSVFKYPC